MEVEQQADRKTAHAQIGLQLHVMGRQQCRDRFEFRDIGPESEHQRFTLVHRRDPNFASYSNAGTPQRPAQRDGIEGFQQSRTTMSMHLDRQSNDAFAQLPMV
jgi:hypothetical protein